MHFSPTLRYFPKNNARNIAYMAVLIFRKNLDLRRNAYSQTASWCRSSTAEQFILFGRLA
jgi:hypothetical protein